MDVDEDLVKLLAELASIAGGFGMAAHADTMVDALVVMRPDSERPYLLKALTRLNQRDASGAERILRDQALRIQPESRLALAYLGLALHHQGRISERDQVLRSALASPDTDADATNLAQSLLETTPA